MSAHDAGRGTARVFAATPDQVWDAARASLRWNHAEAVEEHRAEKYMIGVAPAAEWSWGAAMGVWIDPVDTSGTRVLVIVSRRSATNITAQSEEGILEGIDKAVTLEKRGQSLPEEQPE